MTALVSLNVATIPPFRGKKPPKLKFLMLFLNQKMISFTKVIYSHAFEIVLPRLTISFGDVIARFSLNVPTNCSLTGRKTSKMSILRLLF